MSCVGPRYIKHPARGRKPQNVNKVPFKDAWPMTLKNQVSTRKPRESGNYYKI